MSLPQVWWTDTRTWKSMLFRGEQVDFADICKVFEQTEAKLVQIWEEVILMGQDIRVEYDGIADDLVSKDVGYSFLSDDRNPQLTHWDQLLRKFLQDEDIFSHFAMIQENAIVASGAGSAPQMEAPFGSTLWKHPSQPLEVLFGSAPHSHWKCSLEVLFGSTPHSHWKFSLEAPLTATGSALWKHPSQPLEALFGSTPHSH
ncbi:hypothetical protein EDC04DRAFT_2901099 [Pisolithus marmoratus]|nr:hypothetical protein EDC04DRAFT_2901099 [Pisolithus marmoratus]